MQGNVVCKNSEVLLTFSISDNEESFELSIEIRLNKIITLINNQRNKLVPVKEFNQDARFTDNMKTRLAIGTAAMIKLTKNMAKQITQL